MTALITAVLLLPIGPLFQSDHVPGGMTIEAGNFTHYSQSPTDGTREWRQWAGQLPADLSPYPVLLATIQTCNVGATGWIRPLTEQGAGDWERFIVFDCAGHAETVNNFFEPNNIIGEIDWYTAVRWETVGHGITGEIVWD